jgi:hypothetical protein
VEDYIRGKKTWVVLTLMMSTRWYYMMRLRLCGWRMWALYLFYVKLCYISYDAYTYQLALVCWLPSKAMVSIQTTSLALAKPKVQASAKSAKPSS